MMILPLKKTLEPQNMVIVVRSLFHKGNKYYGQFSQMDVFVNYKC